MAVVTHCAADRLLGEFVELLHSLAVNVDVARFAQNLHKSSFVDFTRNNLCGESQRSEQCREVTGCARMQAFFVKNMLLNRSDFAKHDPLCVRQTLQLERAYVTTNTQGMK